MGSGIVWGVVEDRDHTPVDAYAWWTPMPKPAPPALVSDADRACAGAGDAATILAEQRGEPVLVLQTSGTQVGHCLVGPGGVVAQGSADLLAVAGGDGTSVLWYLASSSNDSTSATLAFGRAAAFADAVTITKSDGTDVHATVSHGWWAAWWPGEYDPDATFTVHGADVLTQPQPLEGTFLGTRSQ